MDYRQEMQALIDQLNAASQAYYNGQKETMTDYEWDALFDRLKVLEKESGIILPDSPTANVSADATPGEKEAHEFAALSLAKTKKAEDLVKWAQGKPIWMSWKLDGLTLVVTYDGGRLTKVVTRGDGHIGTNITHLASGIGGILLKVADQGHLVIRGEAVISYADFETFHMENDGDYANPRNLASGSLTLKNIEELKRRNLQWLPFTLVYTDRTIVSWGGRMDYLSSLGFHVVEHRLIKHPTQEAINAELERWGKAAAEQSNPYPVDGLVIVYDDTQYAAGGSITGHHATRAGYAFKWQDESVQTKLDHVEWSCAASTITPVAVFAPVQLEGTLVKRASLCNISECQRLGIGDKGTILSVIKANKIIPKVVHVEATVGTLHIPSHCPVCGFKTIEKVSLNSRTKTLHCLNPNCTAKQLRKYARFVSKGGMDIDGISEQTLARFMNEGWIHSYSDIYRLPDHQREIAALDGFGEKSAENIVQAVDKAKVRSDRQFLFALCIPLLGPDVAKRLLQAHGIDELIEIAMHADSPEVFSTIEGIGPEKSRAVVQWFQKPDNRAMVKELLSMVSIQADGHHPLGTKCHDLTFVITGDVYQYKNRAALKAYIESQGGHVSSAVSGQTSFLINNDKTSSSSKNRKARQLGIPCLSEADFMARFG